MITIDESAQNYFANLIAQQDIDGLALRLKVNDAGRPMADCHLAFCEPGENDATDMEQDCGAFQLYIERDSAPFLEDATFTYDENKTGGQLTIKAPNIKGQQPPDDAPLVERVQYWMDAEINPQIASHGGRASLVDVTAEGLVLLQFGGGCQGCGMANVTLKEGIEKTLKEKLPEIIEVRDVTDHSGGQNPYFDS